MVDHRYIRQPGVLLDHQVHPVPSWGPKGPHPVPPVCGAYDEEEVESRGTPLRPPGRNPEGVHAFLGDGAERLGTGTAAEQVDLDRPQVMTPDPDRGGVWWEPPGSERAAEGEQRRDQQMFHGTSIHLRALRRGATCRPSPAAETAG